MLQTLRLELSCSVLRSFLSSEDILEPPVFHLIHTLDVLICCVTSVDVNNYRLAFLSRSADTTDSLAIVFGTPATVKEHEMPCRSKIDRLTTELQCGHKHSILHCWEV